MTVKLLVGDTRERIREIPDGSVDLVACSPPFLALRKYGDNTAEMGSERTPADFLDALLELTGEFRRVLAPHGSIAIELGDTYSGSGGAGGDYGEGGLRDGQARFDGSASRAYGTGAVPRPARSGRAANTVRYTYGKKDGGRVGAEKSDTQLRNGGGSGWPLPKSLTLIPTLYPASLAYGRNLLRAPLSGRQLLALCRDVVDTMHDGGIDMTARDLMSWMEGALEAAEEIGPTPEFDRWRVRNVIVWARPNPPVGALGDKVRPATSYITVACTSAKRFFDLDGVRVPFTGHEGVGTGIRKGQNGDKPTDNRPNDLPTRINTHDGAPPLDWWEDDDPTGHATLVLPTQPYPGAHYATWPESLAARLIKMMCPLRVCTTCGEPSRRIVDVEYDRDNVLTRGERAKGMLNGRVHNDGRATSHTTLGWSDCGHDTWRPGRVLDPFAGSGTTLAVAQGLGRDAVGIELYQANAELVRERVGMFLEMVDGPGDVIPSGHNSTGNPRFRAGYVRNDRPTRGPQAKDYGA